MRRNGKRGPRPLYPWDDWFSRRRRFRLRRGRHFLCQPHSMMFQLRNRAAQRGLALSVHIQEDCLVVEVRR